MAYSYEKSAVGENLSSAFGMMDGIENDILSNAVNAYHKLLVNAFEDIGETSCMISDMKCGGFLVILIVNFLKMTVYHSLVWLRDYLQHLFVLLICWCK